MTQRTLYQAGPTKVVARVTPLPAVKRLSLEVVRVETASRHPEHEQRLLQITMTREEMVKLGGWLIDHGAGDRL